VCVQPFWMMAAEALAPGGEPLHAPAVRGMLVGLVGVAFLVVPISAIPISVIPAGVIPVGLIPLGAAAGSGGAASGFSSGALLGAFLLLQLGAAMWAVGSAAQRTIVTSVHPFVSGGVQQLATGVAFAIPALLWHRSGVLDARTISAMGIGAVIYLAIFGGIIGYSAYIFAMDRLPVALVSIYTYINPLVAVCLGWWFYREPFGWREAIAMAIIFIGVAMVKRAAPGRRPVRE
jgi:drug/metabolite transporter (DMT)-like permease